MTNLMLRFTYPILIRNKRKRNIFLNLINLSLINLKNDIRKKNIRLNLLKKNIIKNLLIKKRRKTKNKLPVINVEDMDIILIDVK